MRLSPAGPGFESRPGRLFRSTLEKDKIYLLKSFIFGYNVIITPMIEVDKMDKREIKTLLSNWDVGELISFRQARKGVVNINWIVKTTQGKYVLRKIANFTNVENLEFELGYLTYLKEHDFPYRIPVPIRTKNKENFIKSNDSYFWLYEYIEGRDIKRLGYSELRECAKMMATYHRIIESSNLDNKKGSGEVFRRESVLEELEKFRTQILAKNKQNRRDRIFLKESSILIPLMKSLDGREYSKFPKYPLHRDINPENMLWKNKKLVGLIDFENISTMNDTMIKDVSIMLQYACRDKRQKYKLDLKLARFFLTEYKKHRQLSSKEIALLPDIITAGFIEDFSYAYWMLVNDAKRAKLYRLRLYSKIAQWYHKNKQEIIEKLIN
jgi:homoserine kinase type II